MKKIFVNIHVPKAAGWMFWDILKQNFADNLKSSYFPASYYSIPQEAMQWMVYTYRFTCYTSHSIRWSSLPALPDARFTGFSFVRDPETKFLSYYFYCRSRGEIDLGHPTKTHELGPFVDMLLSNTVPNRLICDVSQEEFIWGDLPPGEPDQLMNPTFGEYLLFPCERFNDVMICLEKKYPEWFLDCSYGERSNVSKKDQVPSAEDLSKIQQLPWIERDRALHQFSHQHLDRLLAECFPHDGELDSARSDFRKRCEAKRDQESRTPRRMPIAKRIRKAGRILLKGY